MNTKISIIIPIYNGLPYLYECLDSLTSQRSVDVEVLLINNGSTDESLSVCYEYAKKYNIFKVFDIETTSIGGARNFGLTKACGEFIMFVDADDFLPDAMVLRDMLKKSIAKDSDICVGNFSRLWGDKLLHATSHRTFSKYPQNGNRFLFTGFFSVDILSYVWAKLFKKSFIEFFGTIKTTSLKTTINHTLTHQKRQRYDFVGNEMQTQKTFVVNRAVQVKNNRFGLFPINIRKVYGFQLFQN